MATSHELAPFLGGNGFLDITDTAAHVDSFVAVRAVGGDATGTFTMGVGSSLSAFTVLEGDWLLGPIEAITLSSGRVLAYY